MGCDKALLRVDGVSLAERAARRLRAVTPEVLIADGDRELLPGWRSIADGPGAGPAAGILGAAERRAGSDLLVLACDLPQVPVDLLALLTAAFDGDILVPRWQRGSEPLCARYRPAALAVLAEQVHAGELALHRLLSQPQLTVRYLEVAELARFGVPAEIFLNLNRPEALERLAAADKGVDGRRETG